MKLKIWAAALLCGVSAVSFCGGIAFESYYYNVDSLFEAHQKLRAKYDTVVEHASCMSDFIRFCKDWYEKNDSMPFSTFDEAEEIFIDESEINLADYVWCY